MVALSTFQNLNSVRQQEIINACLTEFCLYNYENASLSRIIKSLNLAKGSFYRYFESKKDLYYFLLNHSSECRLEHDAKYAKVGSDFFENLLEHFRTKILFDIHHPLESAFIYNVLHESNQVELGSIFFDSRNQILKYIIPEVERAQHNNQLSANIPAETIAFFILQSLHGILDFVSIKYSIDHRENIRNGKPLYSLSEEIMMKEARVFIEIIKKGIAT